MDFTNRRTVRAYSARPVGEDVLRAVLQAAARASNTGNMQTYSIVVTQEEARRQALAPMHFNQPMVTGAPVVLTFCADFLRFTQWCRASGLQVQYTDPMSLLVAIIDTCLAAQHAATAAEELGLGICFLGTTLYNMRDIAHLLELPRGVVPVTTLTMGYPAELPPLTERLPLEAVVHAERYHARSDQEVRGLYAELEAMEQNQAYVAENGKTSLAEVFAQVRYPDHTYRTLSHEVAEVLREQGFDPSSRN